MTTKNSGGITLWGVLFAIQVVLVVLKLTNTVTWGWLYVLIPLWVILGLTVIALLIVLMSFIYWKKNDEI